MTPLAYPSTGPYPQRVVWYLAPNTKAFTSAISRAVQTAERPGAVWRVQLVYPWMTRVQADILGAWVDRLRGQGGRALLYPFHHRNPRGTISGTVLVKGAGQLGSVLNLDGAGAATTLLMGDFIEVGGQLVKVVLDATADGAGNISVTVEAPIHTAPADNAVVTYLLPTVLTKLVRDDNLFSYEPGGSGPMLDAVTLEFEETFS